MVIKFGTDGWRAVIAEDFTFANVRTVARAIASTMRASKASPVVTIGYDTRFLSGDFARTAAEELAAGGCRAVISDRFLSTPALSSSVVDRKADGGIMLSASHNPPAFNGLKFKTSQGASAPEDITKRFEAHLETGKAAKPAPGKITCADLTPAYFKRLKDFVDFKTIRSSRMKVVADPMYGAGAGYLASILKGTGCSVTEIHGAPDPLFGGLHPEPIEQYLSDLKSAVRSSRSAAGLATDGDADRIGVVDDRGRYLTPHQVFPLLLHYLCRYKGMRGKVVQSISLGYVSERIARDNGLAWEEVPVGFKYIADKILHEDILMGGEESGGYGYGGYLPERDGMLNSLMIIEMLASTGKTVSQLVREIEKRYGRSFYLRTDFRNPGIPKDRFVSAMKEQVPGRVAGLKVKALKDYDGLELVFEDDSWLLLRPSGTEPIIRVYSESDSIERTRKIIAWGNKAVRGLSG